MIEENDLKMAELNTHKGTDTPINHNNAMNNQSNFEIANNRNHTENKIKFMNNNNTSDEGLQLQPLYVQYNDYDYEYQDMQLEDLYYES